MRLYFYLFAFIFLAGQLAAQPYFPIKKDKKWGLIDADGAVVVNPVYDAIGEFKRFGYAVMQRDGGVGLFNSSIQEIIPPQYDDINVLDSTLIAVMEFGEWMVVDLDGNVVLDKGYEKVHVWNDQFIAFTKNDKWGLVDRSGQLIVAPKYDELTYEAVGVFLTRRGNLLGLMDKNGREILANIADEVKLLENDLLFFKKGHYWGAVNTNGKQLLEPKFDYFVRLSDQFIKLVEDDRFFIFSLPCNTLISQDFDDYYSFSRKYVLTKKNRRLGLIDWCGQPVLSARYSDIQAYDKGLFRVNLDGKWGVVSAGDMPLIEPAYDYIAPLRKSVCVVRDGEQFGIVNAKGEEIVAPQYHSIELDRNKAKAYRSTAGEHGEQLDILVFDEEGQLTVNNNLGKHFKIRIAGKAGTNPASSDQGEQENSFSLPSFEWFYSPQDDRWGLRKLADGEVQIPPTFDFVQVEREQGFTLVGMRNANKYDFERTTFRFEMSFGLVSNEIGALVTKMEFLDVRIADFKAGYPMARIVFVNGKHGLIDRIGRVVRKNVAFIGAFHNGVARMSLSGQLSGSMKKERSLGKLRTYLDQLQSQSYMVDYTQYDQLFQKDAELICQDCEWGYMDTLGQVIVKPQYTYAKDFINEVGIVECSGKWGMVNSKAKILIPCQYDGIDFLENTNNEIIKVYIKQPKYGLIDTLGQLTVSATYDEIGSFSEGRLAVKRDGLWGFVDRDGFELIPCRFREVRDFSEGVAAVKLGNYWGYIDKQGHVDIEFAYKRAGNFKNGLAWVYTNEGVGYINKANEYLIPSKFEKGFDFYRGVARVVKDGEFGLIDTLGNFLLKPKYSDISHFDRHGLAVVRYGRTRIRYGLINLNGNLVGELNFKQIGPFQEGLAVVRTKSGYGYIDTTGYLVIPADYAQAAGFVEGRAAIKRDGYCGYIDHQGSEIVPCAYSKCLDFDGGKAVVYKGIRKAGLVNHDGELILEPSLNRLLKFKEGRGLVRDEKYRFYYITERAGWYNGYYEKASAFNHGVAVVQTEGKWGIINQKGIALIPPKYDKIEGFEDGFAKVKIKGFSGLTNLKGELIVQPDYEYITYAGDGLFRVEQGDKIGYFDAGGKWVWDLTK
jgi:hypothetical protein